MTIKELIEILKNYDGDKRVEMYCTYDCGCGTAGGSVIQILDNGSYVELFNDEC